MNLLHDVAVVLLLLTMAVTMRGCTEVTQPVQPVLLK